MDKQFRCDECSIVIGWVDEDAEIRSFDDNVSITIKCKDCKESKKLREDYDEFGNITYKLNSENNELLMRD